ncbi:MAG TPA: alanine racemase [Xanthobacteraceae bacterium]|nr:alanine racemase [Xanthobacteraceae bacterium]
MNAPGKSSHTVLRPEEAAGVLTVDLGALTANWRELKKRAASALCSAVVKADAYGIGLERASAALAEAGCDIFFVALVDEARRLRATLPTATIYVLNGLAPGTAAEFRKLRLEPVLGSWPEIDEWDAFAASSGEALPAAIHIDTGMTRHGLSREDATALAERMRLLNFRPSLVMSHLACADEPTNPMNARQIGEFRALASLFPGVPASLANSAGILGQTDAIFDLVRPGISLYGGRALLAGDNAMQPVVRVDIRIVQVRKAKKGDAVGYGAQHHLTQDGRVAICGAGYADGIFRAVGGSDTRAGAEAIVAGQRCPLVGRISMDFFAVDVSAVPDDAVKRGDYATILNEEIGIDELAAHAGTIGYEVLTALGRRYARIYRGG